METVYQIIYETPLHACFHLYTLRSFSDNLKNLIINTFANIIITFEELKYLPKKKKIHSYALKRSVTRC